MVRFGDTVFRGGQGFSEAAPSKSTVFKPKKNNRSSGGGGSSGSRGRSSASKRAQAEFKAKQAKAAAQAKAAKVIAETKARQKAFAQKQAVAKKTRQVKARSKQVKVRTREQSIQELMLQNRRRGILTSRSSAVRVIDARIKGEKKKTTIGEVQLVPQKKGVKGILQKLKTLQGKKSTASVRQKQSNLKNELSLLGLTAGLTVVEGAAAFVALPGVAVNLARNPSQLKQLPKQIAESSQEIGQLIRISPTEALGRIAGEVVLLKGSGTTLKVSGKVSRPIADKLRPSFRGIKKSNIGIKTIKVSGGTVKETFIRSGKKVFLEKRVRKPSVLKPSSILDKAKGRKAGQFKKFTKKGLDIEVIPGGGEKLKPRFRKAIKEADIKKQLKSNPKLPKVNKDQKKILSVVKERGDILTGSVAQNTLLKKKFTRKFDDIDIVTKNRPKLIKELKKKFGKRAKFNKKFRSIELKLDGKVVADLVEFKVGEGGFIKKFKPIKVSGLKVADPRSRLGGKLKQLSTGKPRAKTLKDIELLSGRRIRDLDRPAVTGAFKKTKKQLKASIGKKGPVVTAQEDLFKGLVGDDLDVTAKIIEGKTNLKTIKASVKKDAGLKLKKWLFASPFDPKTGRGQVRVSRLGLNNKEASLLDILLGEEISFKKPKPQILVFPEEKIFPKNAAVLRKDVIKKTKGFVVPEFSSELEVVLGKGFAVKKGKILGKTRIKGKLVPIIEVKKVRLNKGTKDLLGDIQSQRKSINKILSKKKIKKSDISNARARINKLNKKESILKKKLKKETGLDYSISSKLKKGKKTLNLRRKVSSAISTRRIKRKVSPSKRLITKRVSKIPTRIKRTKTPSRPGPRPPSRPRTGPPSRPGPRPPSRPPEKPVKKPPVIPIRKKKPIPKKKPLKKPVQVFDVFGKSGGKFVKLNPKPLKRGDALSKGAFAVDRTTARTFKIVPKGKTKTPGKLLKSERNYFNRQGFKLREVRIKKGRKFQLKRKYIEKTKHLIDTKSEKAGLTVAKLLQQRRKRKLTPTQRKKMLSNLKKARAAKKKLKGGKKK